MVIYPICSSSKGNSTFVQSKDSAILIDVGISFKSLVKSLQLAGLSEKKIKAIFITHEHSDHISGLYAATKFLKVPVFSSRETLKELIVKNAIFEGTKLYEINRKVANISEISVSAFKVFHDGSEGVRFSVFDGEKRFVICTDIGVITLEVIEKLKLADFVFLESNYDINMLKNGPYPLMLKRRIASKAGHLSNLDAARAICYLIDAGVQKFMIGHISQKNNSPQLALKTIISYLITKNKKYNKDYELLSAAAKNNGTKYEI